MDWTTGAEILVEALVWEGVDTIFGYPGGAVLHIYDELWRARDRITHYLVRHEQGAVHMEEGYARATGRVGVVLGTSGPGATNAVTGIANAYMDSTPLVVITGQVPKHLIGTDAFQEVDTVGITRPCVKHNFLVKDVRELALTIAPPPVRPIASSSCFKQRNAPRRLVWTTLSKSSLGRSTMTTRAPAAASRCAVARPSPDAPPVTRAALPSISMPTSCRRSCR